MKTFSTAEALLPLKLIVNNLKIPIEQDRPQAYLTAASQQMGIGEREISIVKILSKSIDLRNQDQFFYQVSLLVSTDDSYPNTPRFRLHSDEEKVTGSPPQRRERPIVVGFGPGGMFAALELIAAGFTPLIFERGKKIEDRAIDVQNFIRKRRLQPESNIQFGEGGAGSFSDGKLFSRRDKNDSFVNRVLKRFVQFGAPAEIEYISKPHLGTDLLCKIVRNIRNHILEHGGEIHYKAKMTDLLLTGSRVAGIVINDEEEYLAPAVFLALGHSARDTFRLLHSRGIAMEQRDISVGVRIEHPVRIIDRMRYGDKYIDFPGLGAATYSINHTNRKIRRGVYTFCMCPGGEIVNGASEEGRLVLNGMSYSDRGSAFSNAALVVSCHREDYGSESPLAGLRFQEKIEQKTFLAGGENWQAPAQKLMHFLGEEIYTTLPETSYKMGVIPADLHDILPDFIGRELMVAFHKWQKELPLFVSHEAILLGSETRTSSPVRLTRNEHFESVNIQNLYPIGEGSGYTGGITSSAADGIRAVERYIKQ